MRVLTGTGRTPFFCPRDCDRRPPEDDVQESDRLPCTRCGSHNTQLFPFAHGVGGWHCWDCGKVFH